MTDPTGLSYAELTEAFLARGDLLEKVYAAVEAQTATADGLHAAIGRLNGHLVQLQEMAQHTNDAVEDAFGVKPSNEPDENHLALIEAAGYRIEQAEATIRALNGRLSAGENEIATLTTLWRDAKALAANQTYAIERVRALTARWERAETTGDWPTATDLRAAIAGKP
jgi:hypothetical protein